MQNVNYLAQVQPGILYLQQHVSVQPAETSPWSLTLFFTKKIFKHGVYTKKIKNQLLNIKRILSLPGRPLGKCCLKKWWLSLVRIIQKYYRCVGKMKIL
jgi:hypothetical protein